jgi:hypothetical protein
VGPGMPPSRDSFRRNRVAPIDGSILALLPSDYSRCFGEPADLDRVNELVTSPPPVFRKC